MGGNSFRFRLRTAACAAISSSILVSFLAVPASAVTITIKSTDGPIEGFNDPSPRSPVGGNPGTTLGAQRLFLFQKAADLWSARLEGTVPVIVTASFTPQGGTSVSATLGFAKPTTVHDDFQGAPVQGTWYIAALANQLRGIDLNDLLPSACPAPLSGTHCPEIEANFNSDVDGPVVLGEHSFYYGIDGNNGTDIDFLSVILHEIGHGLGFLSLVDADGAKFYGESDPFLNLLEDASPSVVPHKLSAMTDLQRKTAIRHDGFLVWSGAKTELATTGLSAGLVNGEIQMFAPATYIGGSSVSHVNTAVTPNQLMEPYLTNPPPQNLDVTAAMLEDMGWTLSEAVLCGDANGDGKLTTADALVALKTSVGTANCPAKVCNVNNTGGVTTSDALLLLRKSVGQNVTLACPA